MIFVEFFIKNFVDVFGGYFVGKFIVDVVF